MKSLPLLFLGIFVTIAFSWTGIVLSSYIQLGGLEPTSTQLVNAEGDPISGVYYTDESGKRQFEGFTQPGDDVFPLAAVGSAKRGQKVYEQMGCLYCHSQQVRREGFGSDFERNWGKRQSVARDYIFQERVMLGTMRTGPDLTNVGTRYTDLWQHQHLYMPQSINEWSIMPPYNFLYEVREVGARGRSSDAIEALKEWNIPEGHEVIPTQRAKDLVAYLMSLNQNYELPEMKFSE